MKHFFTAFILLILVFANLRAQELAGNYFNVFSNENLQIGSHNLSNDALFDHEGVLWLATNSGLVKWNGQQKQIYNADKSDGYFIGGTIFRKIFERDSTALVIESQDSDRSLSLLYKNEKQGRSIPLVSKNNKEQNGYLSYTFQSPNGEIFAIYNNEDKLGVFRLEQDELVLQFKVDFEFSVRKKFIQAAFFKDELWIGIDGVGVWRCSEEQKKLVFDFNEIKLHPSRTLSFLHADKKDRLWLVMNTTDNIYQWNETNNQFVPQKTPFENRIDLVEEDQQGNLIFVSGRYPYSFTEMHLLQDTSWTNYTSLIRPEMIFINSASDFNQSLLTVTKDNIQVVEIKKERVKHFLKEKLPPGEIYGNIIKGINEDLEGNIYFLEEIDGFYKMNKETREIIPIPLLDEKGKELKFRCGGAIHRDNLGNLWFKTCDGKPEGRLIKFNPKTEQAEYFYLDQLIRDIDIGNDGRIWVTSHSFSDKKGRLSYFDETDNQFVLLGLEGQNEERFFPEPRFLWCENKSTIWIGTLKGLVEVNPDTKEFKIYTKENSNLRNDRIIAIHQEKDRTLILGTYGGVQVFDPTTGHNNVFTKKDGLAEDFVCGIIPIDEKRYWLSTFKGLSYWDTEISLFTNFNKSHGFEIMEFNRYAFHASSDGNIYLGNVNGANQFKTEELIGQGQAPRIGISQLTKYYGQTDTFSVQKSGLENLKTIQLNPDITYLELSFFSYDFKGGKTSKILTRLEGYDDDWELVDKKGRVRYRLLRPGKYQLQVKGFSTQGVPSVNKLNIEIVSKPYFYNTWLFYLVLLAGLFLIGLWLFNRRIRQIKEEQDEKQNIQKRFATLELQALQAQLNPHFIFNALGAIQYYIQVNDVESADVYLTRFAQLMRKYLDGSKEKMISLKNEIELLRIYSELEQLRFDKIFDVEFIIDKNLEVEDLSLPSMMIQPFLENAFNHGLSPRKDGKGKLEVHFYPKGNSLICEVRDNGIGREKAKINKRKGHKSRGMTILDEKIQTMKMSGMMDVNIEISDLKKTDEDFVGTLVVLRFMDLLD